ncbi:MAG: cofactor-independent phosphoglycerate mutase [Acutalibacteraceae bacterium]
MKYALILGDGMADYPIPALNGKTPLAVADKPYMNLLAETGEIGLVKTVPDGYKPGSDVANLGALGYDATKCYTGRSPLEALSIGIDMKSDDVAVRTNLVTLGNEADFADKTMVDYSAGEITTDEARELIEFLQEKLGNDKYSFHAGVSYRHCLIIAHGSVNMQLTPPHDISGKKIGAYLPAGDGSGELAELIRRSNELLSSHPVNLARKAAGKNPANSIWFWGQGTRPALENFRERYGLSGGMVSAVDLLKGIAIGAGMKSVDVEGATGTLSTNFEGKAKAATELLDNGCDFVFVHLEAPDECGHQGDLEGKIKAIELVDKKILGPVYEHLKASGEDFAIMVMPDHFTPVSILTHSREPVPYLMYSSKRALSAGGDYNEKAAAESGIYYDKPWELTNKFFAL